MGILGLGPIWAQCPGPPSNEVANCGFETGNPPASWIEGPFGTFSQNTSIFRNGAAAGQFVSESIAPTFWGGSITSSCAPITADANYGFGAHIRLTSSAPGTACTVNLRLFGSAACGTATALTTGFVPVDESGFLRLDASGDTSGSTHAELEISCNNTSDNLFTAIIDDAFAGPSLVPVELQSFGVE